jgi:hypothetical protein
MKCLPSDYPRHSSIWGDLRMGQTLLSKHKTKGRKVKKERKITNTVNELLELLQSNRIGLTLAAISATMKLSRDETKDLLLYVNSVESGTIEDAIGENAVVRYYAAKKNKEEIVAKIKDMEIKRYEKKFRNIWEAIYHMMEVLKDGKCYPLTTIVKKSGASHSLKIANEFKKMATSEESVVKDYFEITTTGSRDFPLYALVLPEMDVYDILLEYLNDKDLHMPDFIKRLPAPEVVGIQSREKESIESEPKTIFPEIDLTVSKTEVVIEEKPQERQTNQNMLKFLYSTSPFVDSNGNPGVQITIFEGAKPIPVLFDLKSIASMVDGKMEIGFEIDNPRIAIE